MKEKQIILNQENIVAIDYNNYWKTKILQWLYGDMFTLLREFKIKIIVREVNEQ